MTVRGYLGGHNGVVVDGDDVGLDSLHHMNTAGSLLTTQNTIIARDIHVLLPVNRHALHRQHIQLAKVVSHGLQLSGCCSETSRGSPGISIVTTDNGLGDGLCNSIQAMKDIYIT